ncbi:MAG: hypothetical protein ACK457_06725 [Flavobacteriia bacterium]|jgi:hypothetical protein
MKIFLFALFLLSANFSNAQQIEGTEIGIDGFFGASNAGGSFGAGLRYGWKFGEYLIAGPIIRYQRYWTNNLQTSQKFGYNSYGAGIFGHARFANALFLGTEIEFMRSPLTNFGAVSSNGVLAPAVFIGGGFSREFNESIRINAGIFYDIVNHQSSPFRSGYFMRRANGSFIPAIYRIAFFFPLT